ncbi:MAG: AbrB/MazE/SpoVT family DNA-binding domain-containing protein [Actinobacteria bacterium]|nr:AbrB/MazE/SpoVT family DNA-binding domain-containing protein [Actinomycetota bacterium]
MGKTKITRKGQVTIPKEAREKLSLSESDYLDVKVIGNTIVMEKLESFESLKGSLTIPSKYRQKTLEEIEDIARVRHAKEVMDE